MEVRVRITSATATLTVKAGVAEVESSSRVDAAAFVPPEWFGRELTGESGWRIAGLARRGRPSSRRQEFIAVLCSVHRKRREAEGPQT